MSKLCFRAGTVMKEKRNFVQQGVFQKDKESGDYFLKIATTTTTIGGFAAGYLLTSTNAKYQDFQ